MSDEERDKLLAIDRFSLDQECVEQSQKFADAATDAVDLAEERDKQKLTVDQLYATLYEKVRTEAITAGDKITEARIDAKITLDPAYQDAQLKYISLKANASRADVTKTAFEQRKSMLELTCKLFLSEYFSDVSVKVGVDTSKAIETEAIKDAIRRKRT